VADIVGDWIYDDEHGPLRVLLQKPQTAAGTTKGQRFREVSGGQGTAAATSRTDACGYSGA
jgi:hypothetical protein